MSALYVAADLSSLGDAARQLSAGVGVTRGPSGSALPSFGHPAADAGIADFARAVQGYAAGLAAAAGKGAGSLVGYAVAFHEAGG